MAEPVLVGRKRELDLLAEFLFGGCRPSSTARRVWARRRSCACWPRQQDGMRWVCSPSPGGLWSRACSDRGTSSWLRDASAAAASSRYATRSSPKPPPRSSASASAARAALAGATARDVVPRRPASLGAVLLLAAGAAAKAARRFVEAAEAWRGRHALRRFGRPSSGRSVLEPGPGTGRASAARASCRLTTQIGVATMATLTVRSRSLERSLGD